MAFKKTSYNLFYHKKLFGVIKLRLKSLIYQDYIKSAVLPILIIEVFLLILYFTMNYISAEKNRKTIEENAIKNINEILYKEAEKINFQLAHIKEYSLMLQNHHQLFLKN